MRPSPCMQISGTPPSARRVPGRQATGRGHGSPVCPAGPTARRWPCWQTTMRGAAGVRTVPSSSIMQFAPRRRRKLPVWQAGCGLPALPYLSIKLRLWPRQRVYRRGRGRSDMQLPPTLRGATVLPCCLASMPGIRQKPCGCACSAGRDWPDLGGCALWIGAAVCHCYARCWGFFGTSLKLYASRQAVAGRPIQATMTGVLSGCVQGLHWRLCRVWTVSCAVLRQPHQPSTIT